MQDDKAAGALFDGTEFTAQFSKLIEGGEKNVELVEIDMVLGAGSKTVTVAKVWNDGTVVNLHATGTITALDLTLRGDTIGTMVAPGERIRIITTGVTVAAKAKIYLDEGR
jgi:hypothetical protein